MGLGVSSLIETRPIPAESSMPNNKSYSYLVLASSKARQCDAG